jgi:hypothetical protein
MTKYWLLIDEGDVVFELPVSVTFPVGKLTYEAFNREFFGRVIPKWNDLSSETQAGWLRVAKAENNMAVSQIGWKLQILVNNIQNVINNDDMNRQLALELVHRDLEAIVKDIQDGNS